MNIFFDTEFTGLHQNTSLVSIGMVDENRRTFYAEFSDYKASQVDFWVEENVIKNLTMGVLDSHQKSYTIVENGNTRACGNAQFIAGVLTSWLSEYDIVYFWGDCPSYDWVLVCELFGGAMHIPNNIYYIPLDLATFLTARGVDPDISRKELSGMEHAVSHNALDDALTIKSCWEVMQ